jgi:hypothetical protein
MRSVEFAECLICGVLKIRSVVGQTKRCLQKRLSEHNKLNIIFTTCVITHVENAECFCLSIANYKC